MKKSRKIGIGIAAVIVAGGLLGGDPSPAGEELVTKPNIEVRTETGTRVTTPKVAESKVTTPKVTTPKVTTPKVTTPKVAESKVIKPKVTKPKVTKPKKTEPKVTKPRVTTPKKTEPKVTTPKKTKPKVTTPKKTESASKKVKYIINTKTKVFHKKTCHHAKKIKNPSTSTNSSEKLSKKYSPCKVCNP